jgi:hypothetical protein
MTNMKSILSVIVVALTFTALLFAFDFGLKKQEKVRCGELLKQQETYPDFYATKSEFEMCKTFNIYLY